MLLRKLIYSGLLAFLVLTPAIADTPSILGPKGMYTVLVPDSSKITWGDSWVKIEWAPNPNPDPNPKPPDPIPDPPKPPTPIVTGTIFVTFIYDLDKATPSQAGITSRLSEGKELRDLNAYFHAYGTNQKGAQPYLDSQLVKDVGGAPCVVIQAGEIGKPSPIIKVVKDPKTSLDIINVVKLMRGK